MNVGPEGVRLTIEVVLVPLSHRISQEGPVLRGVRVFVNQEQQSIFVLEGPRILSHQLPDTVQEEKECGRASLILGTLQ